MKTMSKADIAYKAAYMMWNELRSENVVIPAYRAAGVYMIIFVELYKCNSLNITELMDIAKNVIEGNMESINPLNNDDAHKDLYYLQASKFVEILWEQSNEDGLDQLSEAELETLDEVWAEFGPMTKYEVRDWTHDNCPEWEDPNGSSSPIPFSRVFKYLGKAAADELESQIASERAVQAAFSH